jgi:hypothetical protein
MFGERYFATRGRLAEVLSGIRRLSRETGTDLSHVFDEENSLLGLGAPFAFGVCGEVNAGKTKLLEGLFAHRLERQPAVKGRILFYQYGSPARDVPGSAVLQNCYLPLEFLRDFHLIDTPGTQSWTDDTAAAVREFLWSADLMFFVFAVSNPWAASTWNFISELPVEAHGRLVLIVQQSDLRDATDLRVILGHMADLAVKRLGFLPPIFAVSSKQACEAKREMPVNRAMMQASGYLELETFISRKICESPTRNQSLSDWRRRASIALRAVEDRIEDQSRELNSQGRFLESVEREIVAIREQFVLRLPLHLISVAEVFESEAIWATRLLRRRLGAMRSFFRLFVGDHTGPKMEAAFIRRLQDTVESVAEKDGSEVVDVCRRHWDELGVKIKESMKIDLQGGEVLEETLEKAKARFVERLGHAASEGIGNLKVRNQLDKDLRRRNRSLKSFIFMTLLFTTLGASSGALGISWLPMIFCGLAVAFLAGGTVTAWITHRRITSEFQIRLLDTCGSYANTLRADYEDALRIVFSEYASMLASVRTHLAREKLWIEPKQRRWQELFLTLKAIEQEW